MSPGDRVQIRMGEAAAIVEALLRHGHHQAAALVEARAEGMGSALDEFEDRAEATPRARPAAPPLSEVDSGRLTPERVALLRELWADGAQRVPDMMAALNELPGEPIPSPRRLRYLIAALDPPLPKRAHWTLRIPDAVTTPKNNPLMARKLAEAEQRRSPERDALIRELWPQMRVTGDEIAARCNALPGLPVTWTWLFHRANELGLPGRREAARQAGLPTTAKPAVKPAPKPRVPKVWSEERLAVLRRGWPAGEAAEALLAEVNALPGQPVPHAKAVTDRAYLLRLRRSDDFLAALRVVKTAQMQAGRKPRAPAPLAPPAPPAELSPPVAENAIAPRAEAPPQAPPPTAAAPAPPAAPPPAPEPPIERARTMLRRAMPIDRITAATGISAERLAALAAEEAAIVDGKLDSRREKVREHLRKGEAEWQVATWCRLSVAEVIRIKAEIREERRAAA